MKKQKQPICKNGKDCRYLTLPGGCRFFHIHKEIQYGRKLRKKIKKTQKFREILIQKNIQEKQEKATEPSEQVTEQVLVRPLWITMHKGCTKCSYNGCNKCYYRIRKNEIITAPRQCKLPRDISCRICGAVGDSDDPYCLRCGL